MGAWAAWLALGLAGCQIPNFSLGPSLKLGAGESAELRVRLKQGLRQMIEVEAAEITSPGAELSFSSNEIILPPIYLHPSGATTDAAKKAFAGRLWSASWPVAEDSLLKVVNYGPGAVTLAHVGVEHGGETAIYKKSREHLPFPPTAWSDLNDALTKGRLEGIEDPRALSQLSAVGDWSAQRRRRQAFDLISGLPLGIRLTEPLEGDVEIRSCLFESRGAVIGFSRPDRSAWKPLGPGWFPAAGEGRWDLLARLRPVPRGFVVRKPLRALALYLGAPANADQILGKDAVKNEASAQGKLYRIDSPEPIGVMRWDHLTPEGQWVEFRFDPPQPPGDFVLELLTLQGAPAWLVWNRERHRAPGEEWDDLFESLIGLEVPPDEKANASSEPQKESAIPIRARVTGSAGRIERLAGPDPAPKEFKPKLDGREMIFEANLKPGETEIFRLRDYAEASQ